MIRINAVGVVVTMSVLALALAGCAPTSGPVGGSGSPTQPDTSTPAQTQPAHPQGKFDGIPKHCLSSADISLALHLQIPIMQENDISGTLICSYHGTSSSDPNLQIGFNTAPAGMTVDTYKTKEQSSLPTAVFVPGVGDAAFYYTSAKLPSEMKFISNGVSCVIVTFNFTADKGHMITLAESVLEG
ncbi:MAG TPA: hypothetical protein VHX87_11855 [Galbitalea sp.]|jgi:hypothetical protein|nr:hypothetical protein [Galbitalea sp.]